MVDRSRSRASAAADDRRGPSGQEHRADGHGSSVSADPVGRPPRATVHPGGVESEREVPVGGGTIRLGQLLKLAGLVENGSDVRPLLAGGTVTVDGAVETRRGAQLAVGALVAVDGAGAVRLVAAP